ncbi:MAG: NrsF family protein [Silanimonas sp.]
MKTDDLITLLARQPDALPKTRPARDAVLAALLGLGAAFLLMALLMGPRADLVAALAAPLFWQKVGALGALAALAGIAVYRAGLPGRALAPLERLRWAVPAWLAVATVVTVAAAPAGERLGLFHSPTILVCLSMVPLLSVLPAAAMVWALRRAAPTDPARAARAIGGMAGATGGLAYAFHCQADQPGYVLVWYGLAVALTVVLTQATATRWLRW